MPSGRTENLYKYNGGAGGEQMGKKDFNKELVTSGLKKTKHRTEFSISLTGLQPIPSEHV
jgi:hypothetical protein